MAELRFLGWLEDIASNTFRLGTKQITLIGEDDPSMVLDLGGFQERF
jgi:hypothetical protein